MAQKLAEESAYTGEYFKIITYQDVVYYAAESEAVLHEYMGQTRTWSIGNIGDLVIKSVKEKDAKKAPLFKKFKESGYELIEGVHYLGKRRSKHPLPRSPKWLKPNF